MSVTVQVNTTGIPATKLFAVADEAFALGVKVTPGSEAVQVPVVPTGAAVAKIFAVEAQTFPLNVVIFDAIALLFIVVVAVATQVALVLSVTVHVNTTGTPAVKPLAVTIGVVALGIKVIPTTEDVHCPLVPTGGVFPVKFTLLVQTVLFATVIFAIT